MSSPNNQNVFHEDNIKQGGGLRAGGDVCLSCTLLQFSTFLFPCSPVRDDRGSSVLPISGVRLLRANTELTAKFHLLNVPRKRGSLAWGSKEVWSKTRAGDGQACTSHFHFVPCSCQNVISSKPLHTGAKNCIKTL